MNDLKRKVQPFLLGLLFGIVIAGTFFILRLDNYFKELNFYKNFAKTFLDHQNTTAQPEEVQKKTFSKSDNKKKSEKPVNTTEPETKKSTRDSVFHNDSLFKLSTGSDNIVVRKDELLSIKTVELINLDAPYVKTHQDSLLERVSDIKDPRDEMIKHSMQVEFWKSPLNYKGYKLSKYNVILYGITETQNLKLYALNNILYLKQANVIYKMDYNSDFKPFERIVDEGILSNFK